MRIYDLLLSRILSGTRSRSEMIDFSDTERRALRDYFSALGPSEDGTVSLDDIEEAFISLALCDHREQATREGPARCV